MARSGGPLASEPSNRESRSLPGAQCCHRNIDLRAKPWPSHDAATFSPLGHGGGPGTASGGAVLSVKKPFASFACLVLRSLSSISVEKCPEALIPGCETSKTTEQVRHVDVDAPLASQPRSLDMVGPGQRCILTGRNGPERACRSRTQARRPSRPCPDIAPARQHHPTLPRIPLPGSCTA